MNHYRTYMDRQQVSPGLHARLLALNRAPARRPGWARPAALSACCALILGAALWQPASPGEAPGPLQTVPADPSPSGGGQAGPDFHGFLVEGDSPEGAQMFFAVPAIGYPLLSGVEADSALCFPAGAFSLDLTEEQISLLLWGGEVPEGADSVPWSLFWNGFTLAGRAWYNGEGRLQLALLWGEHPDGRRFSIDLAPDGLPPSCEIPQGAETSQVLSSRWEVAGWRTVRQGETVYESAFVAHGVGVRARFAVPEGGDSLLSDLFLGWACGETKGLSLAHLLESGEVPGWREENFGSLDDALREAAFAPYLPQSAPAGYGDFHGGLTWREGTEHRLWVHWSRGLDDVLLSVSLPEGGSALSGGEQPVDPDRPESYDLRLYSIPWCDSVPEEYQSTISCPTFRAADMGLPVVQARALLRDDRGDSGSLSFSFQVLHENGALVRYDCQGLTAEQVWAMVAAIL